MSKIGRALELAGAVGRAGRPPKWPGRAMAAASLCATMGV
jgi:hypothetical protein